jgi:hypothetical protein
MGASAKKNSKLKKKLFFFKIKNIFFLILEFPEFREFPEKLNL